MHQKIAALERIRDDLKLDKSDIMDCINQMYSKASSLSVTIGELEKEIIQMKGEIAQ